MSAPNYLRDPIMVGVRVIEQDGGYVAVATLSDGTYSTPMGAPVRREYRHALPDLECIEWTNTGPVHGTFPRWLPGGRERVTA